MPGKYRNTPVHAPKYLLSATTSQDKIEIERNENTNKIKKKRTSTSTTSTSTYVRTYVRVRDSG